MVVTKNKDGEKIIFTVEGKLAANTANQLREIIEDAFSETKDVVLDFTNLTYISSEGLSVLLIAQDLSIAGNGTLVLSNVSPSIMDIIDMAGYLDVFCYGMN